MTPHGVTRADIVAEARGWLGTPWRHQQRTRGVAVDCAGLVIGVARTLGLVARGWNVDGYARVPDGRSLLEQCDAAMRRIALAAIAPGDVLVLAVESQPRHIAIAAPYVHGGLSIIHAQDSRNPARACVVEHRLAPALRARVVAAYALPGIA